MDGYSDEALQALRTHDWPGNVRELDHAVERAVLMARGERIAAEDLGLVSRAGGDLATDPVKLADAERQLIQRALDRHQGNVSLAAAELGLSRSALYRRLEKHGLG